MTALIFRALFLLASASIGFQIYKLRDQEELWGIVIGLAVAVVFIVLEILLTKRPIQSISAIVFGLITGMILAIIFFNIFRLVESDELVRRLNFGNKSDMALVVFLSLVLICCYMSVTIVYKTQDRFGFVIPYVEFQKEEKGARPIVIDTSVVIDGRLNDLCEANVFDTTLVIPKFVLQELQHVADSGDRLRRMRGRRG